MLITDLNPPHADNRKLFENSTAVIKVKKIINELLLTGYLDVSVRSLENLGLTDSQILTVLSPYATQILGKITENKRMPPYTIYEMILLTQLGAKWPILIDAIVNNKRAVIKYLMSDFQENDNDEFALDSLYMDIKNLKSFGISWLELDVLNDAVVKQLKHLGIEIENENLTEAQPVIPPKIVKQFEREYKRIHTHGVDAIWATIDYLKNHGATNQQIASLMSERRDEVAQLISNRLDATTRFDLINNAIDSIYKLINVGIKWPSLLQILNRYKDKIAAWAVKSADDTQFSVFIAQRLAAFKKIGFNTDYITQQLKNNASANILKYIYRHGFGFNADVKISSMADLGLLPIKFTDREVDDILNIYLDSVVNRGINTHNYKLLLKLLPNETAKIKQLFARNKIAIVKHMLLLFKEQNSWRLVDAIQLLHSIGIKWPEIEVFTTGMKDNS